MSGSIERQIDAMARRQDDREPAELHTWSSDDFAERPDVIVALLDVARHANALRFATSEYVFEAQDRLSAALDRLEEVRRDR